MTHNERGREQEALTKAIPGPQQPEAYMTAQLADHEFLRDLAESCLASATGPGSPEKIHGRHLATLALTAFKEHVVLCKNITRALSARRAA